MTAAMTTLALGMTACGSSESTGGDEKAKTTDLKVGMAYDVGGRGDQSFNDSAAKGLDRAKDKLGAKIKDSSARTGESESAREQRLQSLVDGGFTTVIAVGYAYAEAVGKVAKANPDVNFAIIDDASKASAGTNVAQITFAEHEGSYLAGAAAVMKSKKKHLGFVGGVETPLIKKFEAGFVAGAKKADPKAKVEVNYLTQPPDFSGFADPSKGKTAAQGMYQKGADIVYHAAGGSGAGVFDATASAGKGNWAIGVDSDQAKTAKASVRPLILTSVVKNVDVGVYDFIKSVQVGSFKGGAKEFTLKDGGVSLATTGGNIKDIQPELDKLKKQITNGDIKVPTSP